MAQQYQAGSFRRRTLKNEVLGKQKCKKKAEMVFVFAEMIETVTFVIKQKAEGFPSHKYLSH